MLFNDNDLSEKLSTISVRNKIAKSEKLHARNIFLNAIQSWSPRGFEINGERKTIALFTSVKTITGTQK